MWGDDDDRLAKQLKNAKMASERRKKVTEDTVDYFPELDNSKGASKSQVTEIERGESSQAKKTVPFDYTPPRNIHRHIRNMEGNTASELGANFGRIRGDSYIFTDDNKTILKPNESE